MSTISYKYNELLAEDSFFGKPISQELDDERGGRYRIYENGEIHYKKQTNEAFEVHGAILRKWKSLGGITGLLGYPLSDEMTAPDRKGRYSRFEKGVIYWHKDTGAHEVHGMIRHKWSSLSKSKGILGYPLSDELDASDNEGKYSDFQHGSIYWHPDTGANLVKGAIFRKWKRLKKENGFLGYPVTDELTTPDGRGRYNHFQRGSIYWHPDTGAHEVHGRIKSKWKSMSWEKGVLGYPVSDEETTLEDEDGRHSHFEHGSIYWTPEKGAYEVHGAIADAYKACEYEKRMGAPTSNELRMQNSKRFRYNSFEKGFIYWTPQMKSWVNYLGKDVEDEPTKTDTFDGLITIKSKEDGRLYYYPVSSSNPIVMDNLIDKATDKPFVEPEISLEGFLNTSSLMVISNNHAQLNNYKNNIFNYASEISKILSQNDIFELSATDLSKDKFTKVPLKAPITTLYVQNHGGLTINLSQEMINSLVNENLQDSSILTALNNVKTFIGISAKTRQLDIKITGEVPVIGSKITIELLFDFINIGDYEIKALLVAMDIKVDAIVGIREKIKKFIDKEVTPKRLQDIEDSLNKSLTEGLKKINNPILLKTPVLKELIKIRRFNFSNNGIEIVLLDSREAALMVQIELNQKIDETENDMIKENLIFFRELLTFNLGSFKTREWQNAIISIKGGLLSVTMDAMERILNHGIITFVDHAVDAGIFIKDGGEYIFNKSKDGYEYIEDKVGDAYNYVEDKAGDAYGYTEDKAEDAYDYVEDTYNTGKRIVKNIFS